MPRPHECMRKTSLFSRYFSFSPVLIFSAEVFIDLLSYYQICRPFSVAKEIFPPSLISALDLLSVLGELSAPSLESLSQFSSTSLPRGIPQQRMLHSPSVTSHKFLFPSAFLSLTHGAASQAHTIFFPLRLSHTL